MRLYPEDMDAIAAAMAAAVAFDKDHGLSHDLEITIRDSNGEVVGVIEREGTTYTTTYTARVKLG